MKTTSPISQVKIKFSRIKDGVIKHNDKMQSRKETREIKANSDFLFEIERGLEALQKGKGKKDDSLDDIFDPSK